MENNNIKINAKINYLNNGKTSQPYPVYATKIKKLQNDNYSYNNGKVFSEKFAEDFKLNKTVQSSENKNEKSKVLSWIFNTINPLNHIPIVSTIHKLSNRTNKSIDIVQSAIGGAIYGGGPIGLAKGVGNWFINKIIPKYQIAIKEKPINNNEISKKIVNDEISKKLNIESKIPYSSNQNENTKNSIFDFKSSSYKSENNKYLNYYIKEDKKYINKIDIDA
ncbi:MAG: hypothetical protein CMJ06_00110 [Pelagibacterales bacterium]|nr:hypothetical protein [Pelagibacterales bacterium]|tara:strand:- start:4284 stop:4946 length:663 start_codon:yes stop_codon:yes gene_type:complete